MPGRESNKTRSGAINKIPLIENWRIIVRDHLRPISVKDSLHVGKKKSNTFCFHGEHIAPRFTWAK